MAVTLGFEEIMGMVIGTLEQSDFVYKDFHTDGMANAMAYSLTDVLGRLERTEGPARVYVKAMETRLHETFGRVNYPYEKFTWADVRYILGDVWNDGALDCLVTIIYEGYTVTSDGEKIIMRAMFTRLVVCCMFCEQED